MGARYIHQRYSMREEFDSWYNLGFERDDGVAALKSGAKIPEFDHCEFYDFYFAECEWFDRLVPPSKRKPFDPLEEPPFFVRGDADDRTLCVDADCDYVTVKILRRIQREFLRRHPLWRVVMYLEDTPCRLVIYPGEVRFDKSPRGVSPHKALMQMRRMASRMRERRLRGERAEVAFLEERLPEAVRAIGDQTFLLLAIVDNPQHRIHKGHLGIVVLMRKKHSFAISVDVPRRLGKDVVSRGSSYDVNAAGCFVAYVSGLKKNAARFCVETWLVPRRYRGPLTIADRETGKRQRIVVKSDEIVRIGVRE